MILRLATRNIFRNRWRTFLTLAGVAVGVAMLSWTLAYFNGFIAELIKSATSVSIGQVQLTSQAYIDAPTLQNTFELSENEVKSITNIPGVKSLSPRIQVYGLVGNDKHSAVAQIIGVDPKRDSQTTIVSQAISTGKWLSTSTPNSKPADDPTDVRSGIETNAFPDEDGARVLPETVIGHLLARQLNLKVGDELVLFFEAADGALGNELLRIVGILRSGNSSIDRNGVFMEIQTLQELAALENQYHVAPIKIDNVANAERIAAQIAPILEKNARPPSSNESPEVQRIARPWGDVVPQIKQIVDISDAANYIYLIFIYFIVAFGLFNASRMSALERKREFAMMLAIGVPRPKLFWTTLLETLVISILGAFIGTALGSGIAWYHAVHGLDMSAFSDANTDGFTYMGVNFSTTVFFVLTPSSIFVPFFAIIPVGFLCGIWPAIQAARTNILQSISNRN